MPAAVSVTTLAKKFVKAARRSASFRVRDALGMAIKPMKLRLVVTTRCNSRCVMCLVWQEDLIELKKRELSFDEYVKFFDANKDHLSELQHISFTGGEPTMREDLVELVRLTAQRFPNASLNINTNAFTTERLVRIVRSVTEFTPKLTVMISLDGIGDAHNTTRGLDKAYEKTRRSVDELNALRRELPFKLEINHVLTEHNYKDTVNVIRMCAELGLTFNPIMLTVGKLYYNDDMKIGLPPEAREMLIGEMRKLMEQKRYNTLNLREVIHMLQGNERDYRCWAGKVIMLVEDNGEVFPNGGCPSDWGFGNLRDHGYSLRRMFKTEQAQKIFAKVRQCRICRLSCESITTLKYPEALTGFRKMYRQEF